MHSGFIRNWKSGESTEEIINLDYEIREKHLKGINSKQAPMTESRASKRRRESFRFDHLKFEFVSDFEFRYSDLRC